MDMKSQRFLPERQGPIEVLRHLVVTGQLVIENRALGPEVLRHLVVTGQLVIENRVLLLQKNQRRITTRRYCTADVV